MTSVKTDGLKATSHLAEIKNGKVTFKQKPISFENLSETMQEIMSFRNYIENVDGPVSTIPEEYLPLIAKLVHESDKSALALSKALQSLLLPPSLESSSHQASETEAPCPLSSLVVEHAIKDVAERVNYGIDTDKHSAALCVWRWEIKNRDWLPKSVRDKACQRFNERVATKKHLQMIFDALPSEDRNAMLQMGRNSKKPYKSKETAVDVCITDNQDSKPLRENKNIDMSESTSTNKKPSRLKDSDAIAKDKERQERKAIKVEKEKKVAEATKKSAAAFANFFKSSLSNNPLSVVQTQPSGSSLSTSPRLNEFQLTFKPFALKKDAHLAPINWFATQRRRQRQLRRETNVRENSQGIIELLDDDGERDSQDQHPAMEVDSTGADILPLDVGDLLQSFVEAPPPSLHPVASTLAARRTFKANTRHLVRTIVQQLNDAEVHGDQRTTQKLTSLLKNRRELPAKVLIFAENNRLGYLGTWTKGSSVIGPRTPFAQDKLSIDYDYDSDAEWEEEEEPEGGVEDVDSLEESIEDDLSDSGSDIADWLVDGDDIEVESTNCQEGPTGPAINPSTKRKAAKSHESQNKKRKVVPLIPFQKGPVWENEIGECDYEPFRTMRIQLFNDTPLPIDPFTFVSQPFTQEKASKPAAKDSGVFVIPAVPERLLSTNTAVVADVSTGNSHAKRRAAKTSFSDTHIPILLQKIDASNTNSFVVLLDQLYQDLKHHGVKKNALEVKLREVSEKDKTKKVWVVKDQARTQYGLLKPT